MNTVSIQSRKSNIELILRKINHHMTSSLFSDFWEGEIQMNFLSLLEKI